MTSWTALFPPKMSSLRCWWPLWIWCFNTQLLIIRTLFWEDEVKLEGHVHSDWDPQNFRQSTSPSEVSEPAHRKMLDDLIIVNHWERAPISTRVKMKVKTWLSRTKWKIRRMILVGVKTITSQSSPTMQNGNPHNWWDVTRWLCDESQSARPQQAWRHSLCNLENFLPWCHQDMKHALLAKTQGSWVHPKLHSERDLSHLEDLTC